MTTAVNRGEVVAGRVPSWLPLLPAGTVQLRVAPGRGTRRRLQALPNGTPVALLDSRWGSRRRLRRAAVRGGVELSREYLLLPGLAAAVLVVEDAPAPVSWLWRTVATVPPGSVRTAPLVEAAVRLGRSVLPAGALGRVAPGRLALGRRA